MHDLHLPEANPATALAFSDVPTAKTWIASQPQAQPMHMLSALAEQIEAIDASPLAPAIAVELLNQLRSHAVPLLETIESRYTRKALPMQDEDQRCFALAQRLWQQFGIAYLRRAPGFPDNDRAMPLQRAATAFRMSQFCHFQAASESPAHLDQLLLSVLMSADSDALLKQPLSDPDIHRRDPGHLAGQIAWALLLRLINPYRFSAAQLVVANRAIRRWRELTAFQQNCDTKSGCIDLTPLFPDGIPDKLPKALDIRKLLRKIRQRIESLAAGESPESLKLGRELSAAACIRLLCDIENSLQRPEIQAVIETGEIELAFGGELAYAIFSGKYLNPVNVSPKNSALAHQRMAIFGFDRPSSLPHAIKKLDVPGEIWTLSGGLAIRPPERSGTRHQSPCLIASKTAERQPRLGVMQALRSNPQGSLKSSLNWYNDRIEAGHLAQSGPPSLEKPRIPVFVLYAENRTSLILPSGISTSPGTSISIEETSVRQLVLGEVLERGTDFVRYAVNKI